MAYRLIVHLPDATRSHHLGPGDTLFVSSFEYGLLDGGSSYLVP